MERPEDYHNEPERNKNLQVNSKEPFNAEPKPKALVSSYYTAPDTFYVRNHAPVPDIRPDDFRLVVDGIVTLRLELNLIELKTGFEEHVVHAALLCAGNRRRELHEIKSVKGLLWDQAAISNGKWTGVKLRDVLKRAGADLSNPELHVEFYGYDKGVEPDQYYGASIPMARAVASDCDVLLAYKLNDEILSRDHGFPLRVVVPGYIGARSVKWLHRISVIQHESRNHYMQKDYKVLPKNVTWDAAPGWWDKVPPVMDIKLQCAICDPVEGDAVDPRVPYLVKGYAVSSGNRITRVEVSCDGGQTWHQATLNDKALDGKILGEENLPEQLDGRVWAWTLWQVALAVLPAPCQLICRAFDCTNQSQPDSLDAVWNVRGVMNNAWHKVNVKAGPADSGTVMEKLLSFLPGTTNQK